MAEVFIFDCHADSDFAEVLRGHVKDARFTTWMDFERLRAGTHLAKELDEAIRQSAALVVILSSATLASRYVAYEWAFALGAGVQVIPDVQRVKPGLALAELQWLDFAHKQARPWEQLLESIEAAANARPKQAVHLPVTTRAIVKEAVTALDGPNENEVERAVERLPDLIKLLNRSEIGLQRRAVMALREFGTPEALSALDESIPSFPRGAQGDNHSDSYDAGAAILELGTEKTWIAPVACEEGIINAAKKSMALNTLEAMAEVQQPLERTTKEDIQRGSWVRNARKEMKPSLLVNSFESI